MKILCFDLLYFDDARNLGIRNYFVNRKHKDLKFSFYGPFSGNKKAREKLRRKSKNKLVFLKYQTIGPIYNYHPRIFFDIAFKRYDLIIAINLASFSTICALFIGHFIRKKPYIVNCENWYLRKNTVLNWLYKLVVKHALMIGAQSKKSYKFMIKEMKKPKKDVALAFNEIKDLAKCEYNSELYKKLKRENEGKIIIVSTAKFVEVKGHDNLIQIFKSISDENLRLFIIGDFNTSYGKKCEKLASEDKRISFIGIIPFGDVIAYEKVADIFALSNKFTSDKFEGAESYGYAPLEAMHLELPCVLTTATGCADDIVVEGKTGFQIEAGNNGKFKEKLEFLINNPEIRLKMGRTARKHVLRALKPEKAVKNYVEIFNKKIKLVIKQKLSKSQKTS